MQIGVGASTRQPFKFIDYYILLDPRPGTGKCLVSMNKHTALLGLPVALLGVFILAGCEKAPRIETVQVSPQARVAPPFELKDSSGVAHRLADFKGQVVLLHFWASWCPPCQAEIPKWIAASPSFKGMPLKMISISVDENWPLALKLLPQNVLGPNMLSLLDPDSTIARTYGTTKFPETYLVTSDGFILEKFVGSEDWTGSRVRFLVQKALIAKSAVAEGGEAARGGDGAGAHAGSSAIAAPGASGASGAGSSAGK